MAAILSSSEDNCPPRCSAGLSAADQNIAMTTFVPQILFNLLLATLMDRQDEKYNFLGGQKCRLFYGCTTVLSFIF